MSKFSDRIRGRVRSVANSLLHRGSRHSRSTRSNRRLSDGSESSPGEVDELTSQYDNSSTVVSPSDASQSSTPQWTTLNHPNQNEGVAGNVSQGRAGSVTASEIDKLELMYPDDEEDDNTLAPIQHPIDASRSPPAAGSVWLPPLASLNLPSSIEQPSTPKQSKKRKEDHLYAGEPATSSVPDQLLPRTPASRNNNRAELHEAGRLSTLTAEIRATSQAELVTNLTNETSSLCTPSTATAPATTVGNRAPVPNSSPLPPPPVPSPSPAGHDERRWSRVPLMRQGAHRSVASMNRYQGMNVEQQRHIQELEHETEKYRAAVQAQFRASLRPVSPERVRVAQPASMPSRAKTSPNHSVNAPSSDTGSGQAAESSRGEPGEPAFSDQSTSNPHCTAITSQGYAPRVSSSSSSVTNSHSFASSTSSSSKKRARGEANESATPGESASTRRVRRRTEQRLPGANSSAGQAQTPPRQPQTRRSERLRNKKAERATPILTIRLPARVARAPSPSAQPITPRLRLPTPAPARTPARKNSQPECSAPDLSSPLSSAPSSRSSKRSRDEEEKDTEQNPPKENSKATKRRRT